MAPQAAYDPAAARRRARLAKARLYLVGDGRPGGRALAEVLPAAIAGGVDVFQLREKELSELEAMPIAREASEICRRFGALFIVNDWPGLALASGADGVHVGQEDMPAAEVRELVGPNMLVGLSTHAPGEIDAAVGAAVDYIGVGPVHETPTKLGRPAVGVELIEYAAAHTALPFFAIGGIDAGNLDAVLAAGAVRVCVLRAIATAADPQRAARELRRAIEATPLR